MIITNCTKCGRELSRVYGHELFGDKRDLWFEKYVACIPCSTAAKCSYGRLDWVPNEEVKDVKLGKSVQPQFKI